MPSNITIFPSNLVPQPLRRPNIVFEYSVSTMKLEVLFAAAIQIANQLLIAPQSGCTEYSIAATSNPSATVQYTDCNTGETKSRPTQDSDVIMLEYDTYETLLAHCSYVVGRELLSDKNDILILRKEMEDSIGIYKKRHKEEYIDETQTMRAFGVEYGYYGDGNYRDEGRLPPGAYEYN